MSENTFIKQTIIHVKNMVCNCCIRVLKEEFSKENIEIERIELGVIHIKYDSTLITLDYIERILTNNGFELILDKDKMLVEQIKLAVIELIHYMNNVDSVVRKADYMVEKLGKSYQHLSKLFSKYEPLTLEKFIILHKIERIKDLIHGDEYSLSEMAYMMDYSSVQYLSNQFKSIAGVSVTDYKKQVSFGRIPLDQIANK